ncbi:MAG TPA: TlpA disulfide reductase family protein [Bacteroidales bacterium]|nr:TlpA disulfide reductase family protein [Bacteroidales bacterium]
MIRKVFFSISLMVFACIVSFGATGYRIQVNISGLDQGNVLLAYHFGDRQFLQDTAHIEKPGVFVFEGQNRLDPGIYLIVAPGNEFFEIIVDQNQHFTITTIANQFLEKTRFYQSPENEAFFEYMRFIRGAGEKAAAINEELGREGTTMERSQALNEELKQLNASVILQQEAYIKRFPDGLFSKVLLAQREPQMPDPPLTKADGTPDQVAMYQLYKSRFWDNIDFVDERLLRTPVYYNRLNTFFTNVVVQIPDSIIVEADRLIEKTRVNDDMFRYTIWFITSHFERSQIMGHDAVFVHMIERYYMTGEATWVSQENLRQLTDRAMSLKPLLIGKVAPDINMFLPDQTNKRLHQVNARFTVLYFWDSECSHCKRVTPQLQQMAERFRDKGLLVFAVNTETDRSLWLNALETYGIQNWINVNDIHNLSGYRERYDVYSVPTLYLLDGDKRILAKRITVDQMAEIIQHELNRAAETN